MQTYIETAEPAGSQTIARRFGLGVSPATIRSTMSELEDKGYLFHPHTSAGRIPTDRAYRIYVDAIMRLSPPSHEEQHTLRAELVGTRSAVEEILRRAAQVLGVLTQELGVAVAPALDQLVLERLELVQVTLRAAAAGVQPAERRGPHDFRRGPGPGAAVIGAAGRPDPQRAAGRAHASGDPQHAPRAAAGCGRHRGRARAAEHLHRRGRRALRSVERGQRGRAGQRADAGRPAGVRLQFPDARPAPADRGARSAQTGARVTPRSGGSPSPSAERTPIPGSATSPWSPPPTRPAASRESSGSWVRPGCPTTRSSDWWSTPAAWWKDCWSERFLRPARRRPRRLRGRDQEGLPQARHGVPSRPELRARGRGPVQGDHRGLRGAARSAEARRRTTATARPGSAAGGGFGFHHVDLSEALNIFMRDFGAWAASSRSSAEAASRTDERRGQDIRVTVRLTLTEVAPGRQEDRQAQESGALHHLRGQRRQGGHQADHLHHLRRQRRGASRSPQHVRPVHLGGAVSHLRRRGLA